MIDYTEGSGKQYHTSVGPNDIGKYVIMPGDPKRCAKIAAYLDDARLMADSREYVTYTGFLDGVKVSVTSTGIGGPSAAIAIEELSKCGAHTFIRIGTCGGMQLQIRGGDVVIATGAIRMEGTSKEYAPIEYPAVPDFDVLCALKKAAENLMISHHTGVVQSKDSFFGQHEPEVMPVSYELQNKWQAWLRMGCLASEMETAALLIAGSFLRVRVGACFLVVANQERAKAGLDNPQVHDTDRAIRTAVEAIRILISQEKSMADCGEPAMQSAIQSETLSKYLKSYSDKMDNEISEMVPDVDYLISFTDEFLLEIRGMESEKDRLDSYRLIIKKLDEALAHGAGNFHDEYEMLLEKMEDAKNEIVSLVRQAQEKRE